VAASIPRFAAALADMVGSGPLSPLTSFVIHNFLVLLSLSAFTCWPPFISPGVALRSRAPADAGAPAHSRVVQAGIILYAVFPSVGTIVREQEAAQSP